VIGPSPDGETEARARAKETRLLRWHMDRGRRHKAGTDRPRRQIHRNKPRPVDGRYILPGDPLRVQWRHGERYGNGLHGLRRQRHEEIDSRQISKTGRSPRPYLPLIQNSPSGPRSATYASTGQPSARTKTYST